MSNTYTPRTLYVIIEKWNVIPEILYEDRDDAERVARELENKWKDQILAIYPHYTNEDLQIMSKLSIALNRFDVIPLSEWLFYHVKHEVSKTV
jgi:hypothetical protein